MNRWSKWMLVALRIAVGWHFLYEGVWKTDSDTGAVAYATSWYTLHSSVARLNDWFAQNPPDAANLKPALERVDLWYDDLVRTFKQRKALGEDQKARLLELRDKVKLAAASVAQGNGSTGDIVNFDWQYVRDEVLKIASEQEGERFSSLPYLQASAGPFRAVYRGLVSDIEGVQRLTVASALARLDHRYADILHHFERAGRPFSPEQKKRFAAVREALKKSIAATLDDPMYRARLADYQRLRERVQTDPSYTHVPFTKERLDADRKKQDAIAAELLGFVNEPLSELAVRAQDIATADQLSSGPFPRPGDPAGWIDRSIRWGLTAIGLCLILGLFTPVAAVAAAVQLAIFYFASPPWPGLPAATLGGHYLYVDRNLIELIAAGVIATTGTGRWAGLDAYLFQTRKQPATVGQTAAVAA